MRMAIAGIVPLLFAAAALAAPTPVPVRAEIDGYAPSVAKFVMMRETD